MRPIILLFAAIVVAVFAVEAIFPVKKPAQVDPLIGDTKAPDMIENHLHVERFGPVHKTTNKADGTIIQEEYWEAYIIDDRNTHVYFVRCTPEAEAKWRAFAEQMKGEANRGKLP